MAHVPVDKSKESKRRTEAAQVLEHLIPSGKQLPQDQSEILLDWLLRPKT